jgi:alpha-glucosidase
MLLLTLRGTPTCYYGDEIGMEDVPIPFDQVKDPAAFQQPALYEVYGRDPERTPMQWDASPNAGFTAPEARPWLPLAADYRERNVAAQDGDTDSMLTFFRRLTALRRAEPALNRGAYEEVELEIEDVLAYRRTTPGHDGFLVALNFGKKGQRIDLSAFSSVGGQLILCTDSGRAVRTVQTTLALAPDEGVILRLEHFRGADRPTS